MYFYFIGILWYLHVILIAPGHGQGLGKAQPNSYYYLKQNGGYEYAFNTDTGMESSQTADHANEVTGHYMYYDNGLPYMVKYRAGVRGFQPEIIPPEKLLSGNYQDRNLLALKPQDNSLNARDLRTTNLLEPIQNNYRLTQTQQLSPPKASSYSRGTDTTLNFVQDALKTMQTQPMHLSFNSGLGQIQHPEGPFISTTPRPPTAAVPLAQPVTHTDVQDINNLASLDVQTTEPNHPYSFNYNGIQSSRTESADQSGNVIGSYSYYDDAGFHDVSYKAGDETGFVIVGRNSQAQRQQTTLPSRQYFRPNSLDPISYNNFRLATNSLDERNFGRRSTRSSGIDNRTAAAKRPIRSSGTDANYNGGRSLRKFRRYSKW